jgi:hypothetical protein
VPRGRTAVPRARMEVDRTMGVSECRFAGSKTRPTSAQPASLSPEASSP